MVHINMHYVYLLKSNKANWSYIGQTSDLRKRLAQHKAGQIRSTKGHVPLELIYYEAYSNASDARKREIELKTNSQQKEILFKRIAQSLYMAPSSHPTGGDPQGHNDTYMAPSSNG